MPFFDLFKSTPKGPSINVQVWMHQAAKEQAIIKLAEADPNLIFIAWSTVTAEFFQTSFQIEHLRNQVITAREVLPSRMTGRNFVFLERHYDKEKEIKFLEAIKANEAMMHVSLSDPLLALFDSQRIHNLMESMGHKEDEPLEHQMITKSIEKAMDKIKREGLPANSTSDLKVWMDGIV